MKNKKTERYEQKHHEHSRSSNQAECINATTEKADNDTPSIL